jgi:hypothetical protein
VHVKKHLSFNALQKSAGEVFDQIDDHRQSGKVGFALHDCLMSALAMMFFQDPSLLSFQRRMQCCNLKSRFGVKSIPCDAVLRKTVDIVDTENINPCFAVLFEHLQRGKQLLPCKLESGHYLIALDGSQYFSSEKIIGTTCEPRSAGCCFATLITCCAIRPIHRKSEPLADSRFLTNRVR